MKEKQETVKVSQIEFQQIAFVGLKFIVPIQKARGIQYSTSSGWTFMKNTNL